MPANVNPSNHIHISREKKIQGVWIVDASMRIPGDAEAVPQSDDPSLRVPIQDTGNISLRTSGRVWADVFVVPTIESESGKIVINAESLKSNLMLAIHDVRSTIEDHRSRLPLKITTSTGTFSQDIYLPRSFHGALRLKTESAWYSAAIRKDMTVFSERDNVHKSFIGSFNANKWAGYDKWEGDFLNASSNRGRICVYFDDETVIPTTDNNSCVIY